MLCFIPKVERSTEESPQESPVDPKGDQESHRSPPSSLQPKKNEFYMCLLSKRTAELNQSAPAGKPPRPRFPCHCQKLGKCIHYNVWPRKVWILINKMTIFYQLGLQELVRNSISLGGLGLTWAWLIQHPGIKCVELKCCFT